MLPIGVDSRGLSTTGEFFSALPTGEIPALKLAPAISSPPAALTRYGFVGTELSSPVMLPIGVDSRGLSTTGELFSALPTGEIPALKLAPTISFTVVLGLGRPVIGLRL